MGCSPNAPSPACREPNPPGIARADQIARAAVVGTASNVTFAAIVDKSDAGRAPMLFSVIRTPEKRSSFGSLTGSQQSKSSGNARPLSAPTRVRTGPFHAMRDATSVFASARWAPVTGAGHRLPRDLTGLDLVFAASSRAGGPWPGRWRDAPPVPTASGTARAHTAPSWGLPVAWGPRKPVTQIVSTTPDLGRPSATASDCCCTVTCGNQTSSDASDETGCMACRYRDPPPGRRPRVCYRRTVPWAGLS